MLDNPKSIPLLIGVSILFLIPIGIGAFTYTAIQDESDSQQGEAADSQPDGAAPPGLATETNMRPRPMPSPPRESRGTVEDSRSTEGIPTGKYSNPPTKIQSGGVDLPGATRPVDDFDSSIERNKQNQEIDTNIMRPDYSAPSSSNNFNRSDDNSLITPLEEEDFLEVPDSDDEEAPTLSPFNESSTQP